MLKEFKSITPNNSELQSYFSNPALFDFQAQVFKHYPKCPLQILPDSSWIIEDRLSIVYLKIKLKLYKV